ncbi:MAG: hypothetical protein ACYCPW_00355 [Nitrososphaerales archaeon]
MTTYILAKDFDAFIDGKNVEYIENRVESGTETRSFFALTLCDDCKEILEKQPCS